MGICKGILPVTIAFFFGFSAQAQNAGKTLMLPDTKFGFTAREFTIEGVTDARKTKGNFGQMLAGGANNSIQTHKVELAGGLNNAVLTFIRHNLNTEKGSLPVIIRINNFNLTEAAKPANYVHGEINIDVTFMLKRRYDTVKLVDYAGGLAYTRPLAHDNIVEPTLSNTVVRALEWFNNWMLKRVDDDPLLARSVKLTFTDFTENPEGDTIYYSTRRPITWADFKGKPIASTYSAEVFPGFGYNEHVKVAKGVINVTIAMRTYLPKSASWARPGDESDYSLDHEQRHFDIVKLITERYKHHLLETTLQPDNYDGPIHTEYFEYLRMMNQLQKQYDTETQHGNNHAQQAAWDVKIDKELKTFGVK